MPIDPFIIGSGLNLLGNGINALTQSSANAQQQAFSREMYQRQRDDALADYNMQNDYNSPVKQMQRLRQANLNPNLMYGNGTAATGAAAPVRASNAAPYSPHAPQVDFGGVSQSLLASATLKQTEQQTSNLQTQNTVMLQDALLKKAQTIATIMGASNTGVGTQDKAFELQQKMRLADISAQTAAANLNKTLTDTNFTINQDERATAMTSTSLMEAAERILRSRAERSLIPSQKAEIMARINNIKNDSKLKELDIDLKKKGIQPHDNLFMRSLGGILHYVQSGNAAGDLMDNLSEIFDQMHPY